MRFPRLRRRRTLYRKYEITGAELQTIFAPPPAPKKEKPVSAEQRRGRILRSATKRQPRSAGELATRSALAAADGSGRAIAADLAALVQDGQLVVHGRKGHYSYTKAA